MITPLDDRSLFHYLLAICKSFFSINFLTISQFLMGIWKIFTSIYRSKGVFRNNISRYSTLLYRVKATAGKWFHFKSLVYLLLWVIIIIVFEVLGIEPQILCKSIRPWATESFFYSILILFLHNSIDFILIYSVYSIGHFEI